MSAHAAEYRLVVRVGDERFVCPPEVFSRIESAQARVGEAVRFLSDRGPVTAVELQQSSPASRFESESNGTNPAAANEPSSHERWQVIKTWGDEVIGRILAQQALQQALQPAAGANSPSRVVAASAPLNGAATAIPRGLPYSPARFRSARLAVAGCTAALGLMLGAVFLWQADGNPLQLWELLNAPAEPPTRLPFYADSPGGSIQAAPATPRRTHRAARGGPDGGASTQ